MCGIAGVLGLGGREGRETASAMARSLHHRGPDAAGTWSEDGAALGHARLSILDLSPTGAQPMESACGRYVLTYNGELYNFRDLRADLQSRGAAFRGTSDTEVLLALIAEGGVEKALSRCNGMFAFGLWDKKERRLTLARDRMGEKPLYYAQVGGLFVFASELRALVLAPGIRKEVDRGAVALFLRFNCVPAPHTVYKGVFKLPPACILNVREGAAPEAPKPYWSGRDAAARGAASPFTGTMAEAATELDTLLRDAVKLRMESDVPLGAFLSGGIDSSLVVALMQAQSAKPVKTFTIGFAESEYNEAEQAKAVAKHLGTEHTELYVDDREAMAVIPRLPDIYDEPFADSSQIPTYLVSRLARRGVTVSLSGDGGDELFAGYNRYFWGQAIWKRIGKLPKGLRGAAASGLTALAPESWDKAFATLGPLVPAGLRQKTPGDKLHKLAGVLACGSSEELYRGLVSHWKEPEAVALGSHEPDTALQDPSLASDLPQFVQRMAYLDSVTYLPDDILVKLDRASMAVSLESRVPLLDHRVVEFAWTLPSAMKIKESQGKVLLRAVLERYVPKALTDRPKMGFGIPLDAWLRGPLRPWAESLLDEKRLREGGFLDPAAVRTKWKEHLSGRQNQQYLLWDVLMFEAWRERHIG